MDNALIVFSNPSDTSRIRLDKEHKAVQALISRFGISTLNIDFKQAANKADLAQTLASKQYRIVQFSGHGSDEGFYVEGCDDRSECLGPKELCDILKQFQPKLGLLILMSCYSDASTAELSDAAAYIVTVHGSADDNAAISFSENFYEGYFRTSSIEKAFGIATFVTEQSLSAVLTRRAKMGDSFRELIAVYSKKRIEPMFMDLSEAEESIKLLGIPRETVVSTLSRKMHVHRWIFEEPRDHAILTVGPYFGDFSWKSADDIIKCHKIFKMRADVPKELLSVWARLIVSYNDLYMSEYRLDSTQAKSSDIQRAIITFKRAKQEFFIKLDGVAWLGNEDSVIFLSIAALINAYIDKAEENLDAQEYKSAAIQLEYALSSIHDFIDNLANHLAET